MVRKECSAADLGGKLPPYGRSVGELDEIVLYGLPGNIVAAMAPADNAACDAEADALRASIALKLSNNTASSWVALSAVDWFGRPRKADATVQSSAYSAKVRTNNW